jgi:hypothetical protein
MARSRRGKFGRLPRSQPSLAATLVALASETLRREDSNILSAWQKGGTFQGQQVTDEMVLSHWRQRMGIVSPSDPQYDEYKQTYDQLDYNIAESKTYLLYKQGKISDGQMAEFYLNWAKKVPKDSAFYRTLQGDAAQFIQNAKGAGRAGAASTAKAAYDAAQAETKKNNVRLGDMLTEFMTTIARNNSIIGENQDLGDLTLEGQNGPGRLEALIGQYNDALHADPAGWAATVAAIKAVDPSWDGNLTSAYFAHAIQMQSNGYASMAQYAADKGKTSDVKKYTKLSGETNSLGALIGSIPVAAAYTHARESFDAVWKNPTATDADKLKAASDFATALDGFAASSNATTRQSNSLRNDASALRGNPAAAGLPSFYENFNGITNQTAGQTGIGGGDQSGDNARFSEAVSKLAFWKQTYDANPGAYTYASYAEDDMGVRVFDPTGKGPVGIVSKQSVDNDPSDTVTVPVPTLTGGAIMQTVVKMNVIVDDPAGGEGTVIGSVVVTQTGGQRFVTYGIERPDGTTDFTPVSPFADGVGEFFAKDGLHLTVPIAFTYERDAIQLQNEYGVPGLQSAFANGAVPPAGSSWWGKDKTTGLKTVVKWDGKNFTTQSETSAPGGEQGSGSPPVVWHADETRDAILGQTWDQSRLALPPNPGIDFSTLAIAHLVTTRTSGTSVLEAWASPPFQAELQRQEIIAAGGTVRADGSLDTSAVNTDKLLTLARIDAGMARALVGSTDPNFGPGWEGGWRKYGAASTRIAEFDRINASAQSITRRDRSGDTPSEITLGHTINIPNYIMPGAQADVLRGPNAQPLISSEHPALAIQPQTGQPVGSPIPKPATPIPAVPDTYAQPVPIPAIPRSGIPDTYAQPSPLPRPVVPDTYAQLSPIPLSSPAMRRAF